MNEKKETVGQVAARAWKTIAATLADGKEHQYGSPELAAATGLNTPSAGRMQRFLRGLGLISYRSEYSATRAGGQKIYTKINVSLNDGLTTIYKHFDAGRSYSYFEAKEPGNPAPRPYVDKVAADARISKVVVADERSKEEVRAIAGPEPEEPMAALAPARKDEAEALIEAARQYANRGAAVAEHIAALTALGVEVDVDFVMRGIKMTSDPELAAIAKVLPVIARLERQVGRLSGSTVDQHHDITELRKEIEPLRKEAATLKAANKRLSERNIALSTPATVQAQA